MKKKIQLIALVMAMGVLQETKAQNVGINASGATPDASAMLDVSATNRGVLIPNVALTSTNTAGPITLPATSLLVYNTATAGTVPNNVTPGYYYNSGTPVAPNWQRLATATGGGNEWLIIGNSGTTASTSPIGTPVNNNFIGTTDNVPFVLTTNNLERMRVLSAGQVSVNSLTTFGTSTFFSQATGNNNAVDGNAAGSGSAVYGQNTGTGIGVFGLSSNAAGYGVRGINTSASGSGVVGSGNNVTAYTAVGGSGGAFTGTDLGSYNLATNTLGTGVVGVGNNVVTYNTAVGGSGGAFTGTNVGSYNIATNTTGTGVTGVYGTATGAGAGIRYGVQGISSGGVTASYGVYGQGTSSGTSSAYGVSGVANGGTSGINYGGLFQASGATNNVGVGVLSGQTVISNSNTIIGTPQLPRGFGGSIFTQAASATATGGRIWWSTGGYIFYVNSTASADYSEYFNTTDQTLGVGEVVAIDPDNANGVRRARPSDVSKTVGVVSIGGTRYNDNRKGDRHEDPNSVNVGMLGQVPVLVSTENGNIKPGDALTLSTTVRGRVVKATSSCRIIGYALTHFPYVAGEKDYEEDINGGAAMRLQADHVMCYLNPGWYGHVEVVGEDGVDPAPVESAHAMMERLNKELKPLVEMQTLEMPDRSMLEVQSHSAEKKKEVKTVKEVQR